MGSAWSFSRQQARQFEALARGAVAVGIEPADGAIVLVGNALGAGVDQAVSGMDVNDFADYQIALPADFNLLEQPALETDWRLGDAWMIDNAA